MKTNVACNVMEKTLNAKEIGYISVMKWKCANAIQIIWRKCVVMYLSARWFRSSFCCCVFVCCLLDSFFNRVAVTKKIPSKITKNMLSSPLVFINTLDIRLWMFENCVLEIARPLLAPLNEEGNFMPYEYNGYVCTSFATDNDEDDDARVWNGKQMSCYMYFFFCSVLLPTNQQWSGFRLLPR